MVELRCAATDLLHPVVREGLATLRGALTAVGRSLPRQVLNEPEGFLGCGDPTNSFAWLHCACCDHHRLVSGAMGTHTGFGATVGRGDTRVVLGVRGSVRVGPDVFYGTVTTPDGDVWWEWTSWGARVDGYLGVQLR